MWGGGGGGGGGGALNRFYVAKNSAKLFCLPPKKGILSRGVFFLRTALFRSLAVLEHSLGVCIASDSWPGPSCTKLMMSLVNVSLKL